MKEGSSIQQTSFRYLLSMLITDFIALSVAGFLAFLMKFGPNLSEFLIRVDEIYRFVALALLILIFKRLHTQRRLFYEEAKEIVEAIFLTFIIIFSFYAMVRAKPDYSRLLLGLTFVNSLVMVPIFRFFAKKLLNGYIQEDIVIIEGPESQKLFEFLKKEWYLAYRPVAIIPFKEAEKWSKKVPNVVISYIPFLNEFEHEMLLLSTNFRRVFFVPTISGIPFSNQIVHFSIRENIPLIETSSRLDSRFDRAIKRFVDLAISLSVVILLAPVFILIALLIKLDSKGPIIFKQKRVGKDGKLFTSYKFRTMYVDADKRLKEILEKDPEARREWEKYWKLKNDPRVTRVGRFLRKYSLDELPQFFNVIKGDMSVVGPRPYLPEEVKYMGEYARIILRVRPGITGLWQVSGRSNLGFEHRIKLDTWYVLNWSLWLDLVILIKTPIVVLRKEGAY